MTEGPEQQRSSALLKEVGLVYAAVIAAIIAFSVLALFVGLVAELLYAIVAFLFFFVPQRLLEKKGEDPQHFGLTFGNTRRGIVWGLGATLLTLPFFVVGYWVWEKHFLERELDFDVDHYFQWAIDTEGEPEGWGKNSPGVWVWSDDDVLFVGIRNTGEANNRVLLDASTPVEPTARGRVVLRPAEPGEGPSTRWSATLPSGKGRGIIRVEGARALDVRVQPVVEGSERWPLYVGPTAEEQPEGAWRGARGLWWLALWIATQFLLIALPEEYFYRGYVQTRFEDALRLRRIEKGREPGPPSFLGLTPAIFLTSILFGIGHLIVPVGGVLIGNRMSVFFPSLVFGWLRRKTDSILAPVIYHACSNLMVLVAAVHFV